MRAAWGGGARRAIRWVIGLALVAAAGSPAAIRAQTDDSLRITETTQGTFILAGGAAALEIGYATVSAPARLSLTREPGGTLRLDAVGANGSALSRFEQPVIVHRSGTDSGQSASGSVVIGWPGPLSLPAEAAIWLIVFDAHGIYALPADAPAPEAILYLGPLEHFSPALVEAGPLPDGTTFSLAPPRERAVLRRDPATRASTVLPTAARAARYRDRFIPEDLNNPGGFMLLGWVPADRLPALARALRGTIPSDPDLPAPGVPGAPLRLILPFDCAFSWVISWGYHHSTPQNRFAVDFATTEGGGAGGQPVYAAHEGTLSLKRYGTPDQMIDVGFAARVTAPDGVTSTLTGHLDPAATLAWWGLDADALPDFEWVTVGPVRQGQLIGAAGRSGYATGPHIHFALWSWDQSLYQPVPLGPLTEFRRGVAIPARARDNCAVYVR